MQQADIDYLDGEITVSEDEPSTIAELVALIGEEAVVENVVANLRYRNKYPRVYKAVSKAFADKVEREVKEEKEMADGTKKQVLVSEMDHLRAVFKQDAEGLRTFLTSTAQSEPLYVKGERSGNAQGKVSAANLEIAKKYLAEGDEKTEDVVTKIEAKLAGYKVGRDADGKVTEQSLGRAIQNFFKFTENEAKKNAAASL